MLVTPQLEILKGFQLNEMLQRFSCVCKADRIEA
jgi:hypothetical protein